ncbi:hypothetical protein E2C01_075784 [Portunus trituberculatus]|uniref:Uncharacterized protein n=1 Tax=Portunus trituberculatus TaxID=210409 RepID=A0A5B7IH75_PORTR|nr:hypothetical protein [Portunus trituberculatus]
MAALGSGELRGDVVMGEGEEDGGEATLMWRGECDRSARDPAIPQVNSQATPKARQHTATLAPPASPPPHIRLLHPLIRGATTDYQHHAPVC